MRGPVALIGGAEFVASRDVDEHLVNRAAGMRVTILPTAAAREKPESSVSTARRWFDQLATEVEAVMVLDRSDAESPMLAEALSKSPFVYLTGGDPLVLVEILRDSAAWEGVLDANSRGAVLAASSAGAMALCETMLAPGSHEPVPGLGMFSDLLVVPHFNSWGKQIVQMATSASPRILGIDEGTGVVIEDGAWRVVGAGKAVLYRGREKVWSHHAPAIVEEGA